jgi:D-alanyl-D-alanine carboxypeptidase/D-alanyl-D-alanine-endopeptidase (penicillin-binding protein 4)
MCAASACAAHRPPPASAADHRPASAIVALRADLDAILADPALAHGTWGVVIKSLETDETLYSLNARKLLMPASNMKIVTLAAAAAQLGWTHTYETRAFAAARVENGVLAGDLVVVGTGDPSLAVADGSAGQLFDAWAAGLKARGIRAIAGRIVGNDRAFERATLGFGWSWDDLADDYAAGVGALQFNENAVKVTVRPGPSVGDSVAIAVEPPGSGISVSSDATTGGAGTPAALTTERLPGQQQLRIGGTLAQDAAPAVLTVSVDNPTLFFTQSLRQALIARGIDVRGAAVVVDDVREAAPADGPPILSYRSPLLSTLAQRLMKASQNQYAEALLKTLTLPAGSTATAAGAFSTAGACRRATSFSATALASRATTTSPPKRWSPSSRTSITTTRCARRSTPRCRSPGATARSPIA